MTFCIFSVEEKINVTMVADMPNTTPTKVIRNSLSRSNASELVKKKCTSKKPRAKKTVMRRRPLVRFFIGVLLFENSF